MEPADVPQIASGNKRASCKARTTPKWYVPNAPPPLKANAVAPYASLATPKRLRQTLVRSSSEHVDESQSTDAATCEPARTREKNHPLHAEMETSRVDGVSARLKRLSTLTTNFVDEVGDDDLRRARVGHREEFGRHDAADVRSTAESERVGDAAPVVLRSGAS